MANTEAIDISFTNHKRVSSTFKTRFCNQHVIPHIRAATNRKESCDKSLPWLEVLEHHSTLESCPACDCVSCNCSWRAEPSAAQTGIIEVIMDERLDFACGEIAVSISSFCCLNSENRAFVICKHHCNSLAHLVCLGNSSFKNCIRVSHVSDVPRVSRLRQCSLLCKIVIH